MEKDKILINMSKIGRNGTGLYNFSCRVIEALKRSKLEINVLAGNTIHIDVADSQRIPLPDYLVGDSKISISKPILWQLYMMFKRYSYPYVLSTTHHMLNSPGQQIITIHDIRPYYYPDSFLQKLYFRYLLPSLTRKAAGIIAVSEFTKKCLHNVYSVPLEKIQVVPNVVDVSMFRYAPNTPRKNYLLVVGGTYYHKNITEIIDNAALWADRYSLYIIAGDGAYKQYLKEYVKAKDLSSKVVFLEKINNERLVTLYQEATALVYPSLIEGFGIPPIEAMATGTPVIVSDIEVFRENYDDAPIYVTLGDKASWKKAFASLSNDKLIVTKTQRGLTVSKNFSQKNFDTALYAAISNIIPELKPISQGEDNATS